MAQCPESSATGRAAVLRHHQTEGTMATFTLQAEATTMQTALILIDVQQSFVHRPYWATAEVPAFLAAVNALIQGCVERGIPIVRVFHTDGPRTVDNAFAVESGLIRPLDGLTPFDAALTVEKHRHSALVGTGLPIWLHQKGIRRLIVAGIRTEQCCETTTRHASDEGWAVDYVTAATLTFDMSTPKGERLSAAQIRERTETVLAGRFATIASVDEALAQAV
jgi:nicotinamidase-related amidase